MPIMDPIKAPPQIFDRSLLKTRRARAARRGASFLAERCAIDAAERVCDVNRRFDRALIIGPSDFGEPLLKALPADKVPGSCVRAFFSADPAGLDVIAPDDALPFEPESFDLIISGLSLHTVSDLPGALISAKRLLKPDGLFIGAMFGGDTLTELRRAAYAADDHIFGGMSPRVLPFADYSQAAALLHRSGFALPVVDTDRITVRYKDISKLFSDLRDLGDMNMLAGRDKRFLGKAWRSSLIASYKEESFSQERFIASFEVLWMTGWAPHESQQKPLKPGSAKMRLADALGATEKPIK